MVGQKESKKTVVPVFLHRCFRISTAACTNIPPSMSCDMSVIFEPVRTGI